MIAEIRNFPPAFPLRPNPTVIRLRKPTAQANHRFVLYFRGRSGRVPFYHRRCSRKYPLGPFNGVGGDFGGKLGCCKSYDHNQITAAAGGGGFRVRRAALTLPLGYHAGRVG